MEIRMGEDFENISLLEFYSDWLETLGKYSWHVVLLYKKLWKTDFTKFQNPCNPLNNENLTLECCHWWLVIVESLKSAYSGKVKKFY